METKASFYQEATRRTAIYPGALNNTNNAITYCVLGLSGEAGEIANKWKKVLRDGVPREEIRQKMVGELGDVMWYVARTADELGIDLQYLMDKNLDKLARRKSQGTLQGSGDQR